MTPTDLSTMLPSPNGSLAPAQGPDPSQPPLDASEQPWTVLCVDDEPGILSALKRVLRAEDCKVLQATGGTEALQLMETHAVDVVVSDMRMPGMDGAAFLGHVRVRWPETARILLTGYADMKPTSRPSTMGRFTGTSTSPGTKPSYA